MKEVQVKMAMSSHNKQAQNKQTKMEHRKKINNNIYLKIASLENDKTDSAYSTGFILGYN
jgi:hypothetical protein